MRAPTLSLMALIAGLALPLAAVAGPDHRGAHTAPAYHDAGRAPLHVIRHELRDLRYQHDRLLRRADRAWRRGNPLRAHRLRADARDLRRRLVRLERRHQRLRPHRRHALMRHEGRWQRGHERRDTLRDDDRRRDRGDRAERDRDRRRRR